MSDKLTLVLENGMCFEGRAFGARKEITGEVVFTTGMANYLETLTDPACFGQIVVQTFPLIGNYGVIPSDFQSVKPALSAYIVHEWCQQPSNFRSEGRLDTFLEDAGIPGLCGIDTRSLVRALRENGVMRGRFVYCGAEQADIDAICGDMRHSRIAQNAVESVTRGEHIFRAEAEKKRRVVLWDFGAKQSLVRELTKRGCEVVSVPSHCTAEEIASKAPDGVILSGGPGNPMDNPGIIAEITKLCAARTPMFAIGLGHQLLAAARGGQTFKMKFGHRGANQPVRELSGERITVTTQNHGYAVCDDNMPQGAQVSWRNTTDKTCEGIIYSDIPAFSVQFDPECCNDSQDGNVLFESFFMLTDKEDVTICR